MKSKNSKAHTAAESAHMAAVKSLSCVLCGSGPCAAHHTKQGNHFTVIALCYDCHQGPHGWHGDKTLWRIFKMDENSAINETLRRLQ
jgi:hypothetical protein